MLKDASLPCLIREWQSVIWLGLCMSDFAFLRVRLAVALSDWRLGIVENFDLLARVCLLESCLSIVLFVCMGCVYLFSCVHTRLRLFGCVLTRLAYISIRFVIAQALVCL